jgi:EKC/KEOPS complex subunit PCC1/LAGE3
MEEFAPDPDMPRVSDEELERIRLEAGGGVQGGGIELKGNGVGAGSGQEIAS